MKILEEMRRYWGKDLPGHHETQPAPGIRLCCIAPEARECLDEVMEAWEEHYRSLKANNPPNYEPGFYGLAYWLIRWSGLVVPAKKARVDMEMLLSIVEPAAKYYSLVMDAAPEVADGGSPAAREDARADVLMEMIRAIRAVERREKINVSTT